MTDQSALICMGGLIIAGGLNASIYPLQYYFHIQPLNILTIHLLTLALCPVYWIYMSYKLRAVLRKWTRILC